MGNFGTQSISYFMLIDVDVTSLMNYYDLYTSAAIPIYKYFHVYYKMDETPFSENDRCDNRMVKAQNAFGESK